MLKKYSHKVGMNFWHIEFVTKYRYKIFDKEKQNNLIIACLRKVCNTHSIKIHTLEVLEDHVHMLVTLPKEMLDSKAMQLIKGGSAFKFFKNHPKSRLRLPNGNLWSAGGCITTVGYNESSTVFNYIENQKEHHAIV